jgi:hypothetical protein
VTVSLPVPAIFVPGHVSCLVSSISSSLWGGRRDEKERKRRERISQRGKEATHMENVEDRVRGEYSRGLFLRHPQRHEQDAEERLAEGELRDAFRRELCRYEGDSISSDQLVEAVRSSNHPAIKEAMSGWTHRELRFLWAECDTSNTGYVALGYSHTNENDQASPVCVLKDQVPSNTRHRHMYRL